MEVLNHWSWRERLVRSVRTIVSAAFGALFGALAGAAAGAAVSFVLQLAGVLHNGPPPFYSDAAINRPVLIGACVGIALGVISFSAAAGCDYWSPESEWNQRHRKSEESAEDLS